MKHENKRGAYRIDTVIPCSYHIIPEEEIDNSYLPSELNDKYIEEFFLRSLNQVNSKIDDYIFAIGSKSTILADAFSALNSKIDFLFQSIDKKQLSNSMPRNLVNISVSGIAISIHKDKVHQNDKVDLMFQLDPEDSPILVRCDVVNIYQCEDSQDERIVGLKYQSLSEEKRRQIQFFIQRKEFEMSKPDLTHMSSRLKNRRVRVINR
ncbi:PilZ domain-containing protein [Hydrogenovibrio sp. SC-1]|uniref:PilZ domain-containing protein n=1 Tax=Hydrogenovibrio sp. SC-1 TaxID=2065820 RepID=UPI001179A909|nr:PilZ domain-containing protein [Hydrogenovibrio sp. SC-1]